MRLPPEEIARRLQTVATQPVWLTVLCTLLIIVALWWWRRSVVNRIPGASRLDAANAHVTSPNDSPDRASADRKGQ